MKEGNSCSLINEFVWNWNSKYFDKSSRLTYGYESIFAAFDLMLLVEFRHFFLSFCQFCCCFLKNFSFQEILVS